MRVLDVRHPEKASTTGAARRRSSRLEPAGGEPGRQRRSAARGCERDASAEAVRWLRSRGIDASYLGGGRLRSRPGAEDGEEQRGDRAQVGSTIGVPSVEAVHGRLRGRRRIAAPG
jgi:hypothetical protein